MYSRLPPHHTHTRFLRALESGQRLPRLLREVVRKFRYDGDHRTEAEVIAWVHRVSHGAGDREPVRCCHGRLEGVLRREEGDDQVDLVRAQDVRERIFDAERGDGVTGLVHERGILRESGRVVACGGKVAGMCQKVSQT